MPRDSLYRIRDRAIKSGRVVFSVQQIANITRKKRTVAKVYSSRLVKRGMATKLSKGKIALSNDDFVIATQLIEPSYISLNSALAFHGISNQITKYIECVTTKNSIYYKKFGIRYHKISTGLFFGYERLKKDNSYFFVASPEKALIDGIYLNIYSFDSIKDYLNDSRIDIKKLIELIKKFDGKGSKKLKKVILSLIKNN